MGATLQALQYVQKRMVSTHAPVMGATQGHQLG